MSVKRVEHYINDFDQKQLFWLFIILLFIFILHGKLVPYGNESIYLVRLRSDFLLNDWTLSLPANEHWLFNLLFSAFAAYIPLEVVGWLGRFFVWSICGLALIKIGKLWEIKNWQITLSIIVWIAQMQGFLVIEWIFGGFEAKGIAYCLLLFSLFGFATRNILFPSIFLGLAFSFHPIVGMWGGLAAAISLVLSRTTLIDLLKSFALVVFFASPALIVIFLTRESIMPLEIMDWKFVVKSVFPFHLDTTQFNNRDVFWLFSMLIFNVVSTWKSGSFSLRFFSYFQIALSIFFLSGVAFGWLEMYNLLGLMPMRLMPLFVPLFFLFTTFYLISTTENKKLLIAVVAFSAFVTGLKDPTLHSIPEAKLTIKNWFEKPDDLTQTYAWISKHTPNDALVLSPPIRRDVWYLSQRATVATFRYPVYERLSEWHTRINDLTQLETIPADDAEQTIELAFNGLTQNNIEFLKEKYGTHYLISSADYSYPRLFETNTYKVYDLTQNER